MTSALRKAKLRCAIYTGVSSDAGLEQDFNSLDNQREAAEAYVRSQAHEGWVLQRSRYDDGGFSGGSMERPALQNLLADVEQNRIDVSPFATRGPTTREGVGLKSGALVVREWNCRIERVMVLDEGYAWNGGVYRSLSRVAKAITGTNWNGHRFFGLKDVRNGISRRKEIAAPTSNAALGTGVSRPRQAQANQEIGR